MCIPRRPRGSTSRGGGGGNTRRAANHGRGGSPRPTAPGTLRTPPQHPTPVSLPPSTVLPLQSRTHRLHRTARTSSLIPLAEPGSFSHGAEGERCRVEADTPKLCQPLYRVGCRYSRTKDFGRTPTAVVGTQLMSLAQQTQNIWSSLQTSLSSQKPAPAAHRAISNLSPSLFLQKQREREVFKQS